MVLRKPYRFLIKHFRFIHLLLALMSGYLLMKTNNLINFFNAYINNSETLIGSGTSDEYFTGLMILFSIGILAGSAIILFIMKMKEKPIKFYIINIVLYSFIAIIYLYDKSIIQRMELSTLDIRTVKLTGDLTLICFLVQTLSTIILFVRAIGFNIRRFNFEQDLKLDISESDNEEFEFDVEIDKNKLKRKFNKKIRNFKYSYHENKFLINIAILLVLVLIGLLIILNKTVFNKVYKQNTVMNVSDYSYLVTNSYVVNTDYYNNKITDNYLVVVKLKIKSIRTEIKKFETARVLLRIGKVKYNPTTAYKDSLVDLGNTYNGNKLSNEFKDYILVFEIPKKYISKKKIFTYSDPYNGVFKTKLSTKKINNKAKAKAKLGEKLTFNTEIIKNVDFSITNFSLDNKIKSTYNFCETSNVCYDSYEYITPSLSDNYTKVLLKIEGNANFNGQTISNFDDLADFVRIFGTIRYKMNDEIKEMNIKIKEIVPTKSKKEGTYYFEILDEIKHSPEISIVFKIRGSEYEYVLKS